MQIGPFTSLVSHTIPKYDTKIFMSDSFLIQRWKLTSSSGMGHYFRVMRLAFIKILQLL